MCQERGGAGKTWDVGWRAPCSCSHCGDKLLAGFPLGLGALSHCPVSGSAAGLAFSSLAPPACGWLLWVPPPSFNKLELCFAGWLSPDERVGAFPGGSECKESPEMLETPVWSLGQVDRSPREGNGHPLQYFCLEKSVDRRAWQATAHGVTKRWTWLRDEHFHFFLPWWLPSHENTKSSPYPSPWRRAVWSAIVFSLLARAASLRQIYKVLQWTAHSLASC